MKAPPRWPRRSSPWDVAFGGALMSDYNFRGISQSDRGPSVTAYVETRYNVNPSLQLYAGSQYWAVTLADRTRAANATSTPASGRPSVRSPSISAFIYYWYPRERQVFTDARRTGRAVS